MPDILEYAKRLASNPPTQVYKALTTIAVRIAAPGNIGSPRSALHVFVPVQDVVQIPIERHPAPRETAFAAIAT
jgi:hypothetical protein